MGLLILIEFCLIVISLYFYDPIMIQLLFNCIELHSISPNYDYPCMLSYFIEVIAFYGDFDGFSYYKVMIEVFKLISSLRDTELKFSKRIYEFMKFIWNMMIFNLYGYYCKFKSLLWLFMKVYEIMKSKDDFNYDYVYENVKV